jgi:hypothetical protein
MAATFAVSLILIFTRSIDPKNTSQEKIAGDPDTSESYGYNLAGVSPDFAALINAIRNEAKANRREEQREDRGKALREKITIGLIAATLTAVAWQVREMIKVYEPVKEQADAAKKQADISAKAVTSASRAWLGPLTATINSVQKDKGLEGIVQYQNTGREPAIDVFQSVFGKTYPLESWKNEEAAKDIGALASGCLAITDVGHGLQVVYPNTGFSAYQIHFDTSKAPGIVIVDDDMIAGKTIFKVQGCFVYRTIETIHHSAFCYFYQGNYTSLPNLNICNVGNAAD